MRLDVEYDKCPRILVISNNSFSTVKNNGKTLDSFFDGYPTDKLAQLYFNDEEPNGVNCNKYYQVTDRDVLTSLSKKSMYCGRSKKNKIYEETLIGESSGKNTIINKLKNYDSSRIIRELVWKYSKWNNEGLNKWLDEFKPEFIFFCAGDSGFAYDITKYIKEKYNTKLAIYITDDYVLPRRSISIAWWIRRAYILKKMKENVQNSDLFITISEQMRQKYKTLFNKDSILAVNMVDSMNNDDIKKTYDDIKKSYNEKVTLVYAGGLHFNRYKVLNLLSKSIKEFNENNKIKVNLMIYSGQVPTKKQLKYMNIEGASKFCGKLDSTEVRKVLNLCDIPVHVESFDRKSREATRLSISTKIPEYLSLKKPILAIGPEEVASMQYLKNISYCINNKNLISKGISDLIYNDQLRKNLAERSFDRYKFNHDKKIPSRNIILEIATIYSK